MIDIRKNRYLKANLLILLLVLLVLAFFSDFLHNHLLIEPENPDCPLYIVFAQSLMTSVLVFALYLILVKITGEIPFVQFYLFRLQKVLPDNKSPPFPPL